MGPNDGGQSLSRRLLLKALGTTGTAAALGADTATANGIDSEPSPDTLGSFEASLDGWQTNGGNELERVSSAEFGTVVTNGDHALGVGINGDPYPMIWREDLADLDLATSPNFIGDVYAISLENDADVVFDLRLHYNPEDGTRGSNRNGKGKSNERTKGGKPRVVKSDPITIPQETPHHITWDMQALPDVALENPKRLEIAWHPADNEPRTDANGHGPGPAYEGVTFFDSLRLTSNSRTLSTQRMKGTLNALQREYGSFKRVVTETTDGDVETGVVEFLSGASVEFTFEVLGPERYQYTIAGETFELGGGWE